MGKETDEACLLCTKYDECNREDSKGCTEYEFYKCDTCIDKIIENDEIPRCFRNGVPCMDIKFCTNERRKLIKQ